MASLTSLAAANSGLSQKKYFSLLPSAQTAQKERSDRVEGRPKYKSSTRKALSRLRLQLVDSTATSVSKKRRSEANSLTKAEDCSSVSFVQSRLNCS
jgi:hypothetical protein